MQKLPERIRAAGTAFFTRRKDLYAIAGASTGERESLAELAGGAKEHYSVFRGAPPADVDTTDVIPVYGSGEEGPVAVPTGRVFIRLQEGLRPNDKLADFAAAGFEIERTVSYAPHAVWLRPTEGGVARALNGIAQLEAIPDVAHVEPQMLLERTLKQS